MDHKRNVPISIPISVPKIGNNGEPQFDPIQAIQKKCECGAELFVKAYRIGLVSKLAINNKTNQDIVLEIPVHICLLCAKELRILD